MYSHSTFSGLLQQRDSQNARSTIFQDAAAYTKQLQQLFGIRNQQSMAHGGDDGRKDIDLWKVGGGVLLSLLFELSRVLWKLCSL